MFHKHLLLISHFLRKKNTVKDTVSCKVNTEKRNGKSYGLYKIQKNEQRRWKFLMTMPGHKRREVKEIAIRKKLQDERKNPIQRERNNILVKAQTLEMLIFYQEDCRHYILLSTRRKRQY